MSKIKNQVHELLSQGKTEKALFILKKNCKKKPRNAENWATRGFVYGDLGFYDKAEMCLKRSISLTTTANYTYRVHRALGSLYESRKNYREAITHYENVLELKPEQNQIYLNLASCLKHERRYEEAIHVYKQLLSIDRENYQACRYIGQLYEQTHQLKNARKYAELSLKKAADDIESHFLIAQLDLRANNIAHAKIRLKNLLKMNMPSQHRAVVTKELARVLEKDGNYQEAFKLLETANRCFESQYREQSGESDKETYRSEIHAYSKYFSRVMTACWLNDRLVANDMNLVFLVGFPRSGTTLTEQILESLPYFTATHEIPVLPRLTRNISRVIKRSFSYPKDMDTLSNDEVVLLRAEYIRQMEKNLHHTIDADKLLLDKLPLNIIHLGFISRVFPEAKILVAIRDPRDVCLSCFTQTFNYNQAMRQFLEISDTVRFYACVMGLWLYYRKELPINVLETRYEDIVDDFEVAARRILKFVGVEWHDDVLNFYQSAKSHQVFTPSYQSVTKPIYRAALNKWKNYEEQLQPSMHILENYIHEFGYSAN